MRTGHDHIRIVPAEQRRYDRACGRSCFSLTVLHTPGHTPDSVTYWSKKENAAFVGDTIFKGSAGLTRFPGGDASALRRSIAGTIFALPPATVLYSGHSEPTAVGAEMS
ncbi:MAG: MBL fold metallo-hydrolase [Pyramidobacter sp.]|nr:MBL fold metallo-hydrolase [Pyramidobacter sp.]